MLTERGRIMLTKKTQQSRRLQFPLLSRPGRAPGRYPGILAAFVAALALGQAAQAEDCTDIGGMDDGNGNCTLSVEYVCTGNVNIMIPGDLTIEDGGAITCGSFNLDLDVGGDLDLQSGGEITANGTDNTGTGSAGLTGAPGDAGDAGLPADGAA